MRDIVRPSLASRSMSLSLAVYSCSLRAMKTISCSLLDSLARSFLGRPATPFKVIFTTIGIADRGTLHREFHPQGQLAREDPMAAAPATVAWQVTCAPPTDKRWPLPPLFIKIGVRSFAESFSRQFSGSAHRNGNRPKTLCDPLARGQGGSEERLH